MSKSTKWYAVYIGDEFIVQGTIYDIAKYLNRKVSSVLLMKAPSNKSKYTFYEVKDEKETKKKIKYR